MNFQKVDQKKLEYASDIFKGFGNPIRIRIIDALQDNGLRVKDLSELIGYPQPIISQQLKILKGAGIVHKVKDGGKFCYQLTNKHFVDMIKCMRGCLGI